MSNTPKTYEEYLTRTNENTVISGFGLDVATEYPRPFCAAPHWAKSPLMETEKVLSQPHTCEECGRSEKFIFVHEDGGATTRFELVQTGGDDQPDYFAVKSRRVEA